MTKKELLKTLGRHGVKQFDPTGEKFDPNLHEALYQAPILGKEPGTVFETSTLGYTLNDRTLRAAQVGVVSLLPLLSARALRSSLRYQADVSTYLLS
jgi:molecular chaperone GrpE